MVEPLLKSCLALHYRFNADNTVEPLLVSLLCNFFFEKHTAEKRPRKSRSCEVIPRASPLYQENGSTIWHRSRFQTEGNNTAGSSCVPRCVQLFLTEFWALLVLSGKWHRTRSRSGLAFRKIPGAATAQRNLNGHLQSAGPRDRPDGGKHRPNVTGHEPEMTSGRMLIGGECGQGQKHREAGGGSLFRCDHPPTRKILGGLCGGSA